MSLKAEREQKTGWSADHEEQTPTHTTHQHKNSVSVSDLTNNWK